MYTVIMAKILYFESDQGIAKAYLNKLRDADFVVHHRVKVESEPLDVVKNIEPDLVLLNLHTSAFDRFPFIEQLRKNPAFKELPVFCLSPSAQPEEADRCRTLGCVEYWGMNNHLPDQLVKRIRSILNIPDQPKEIVTLKSTWKANKRPQEPYKEPKE